MNSSFHIENVKRKEEEKKIYREMDTVENMIRERNETSWKKNKNKRRNIKLNKQKELNRRNKWKTIYKTLDEKNEMHDVGEINSKMAALAYVSSVIFCWDVVTISAGQRTISTREMTERKRAICHLAVIVVVFNTHKGSGVPILSKYSRRGRVTDAGKVACNLYAHAFLIAYK